MTFRLDLNLQDMKKIVGWNESNFKEYRMAYSGLNIPCRTIYSHKLSDVSDIGFLMYTFTIYYERFFSRFLGVLPYKTNFYNFISEPLENVRVHGGEDAKTVKTLIEHYHPSDSSKFILRITNPKARKWDYERVIKESRFIDERGSRHWFDAVKDMEFAFVSYENDGKDFLALITIKPEES